MIVVKGNKTEKMEAAEFNKLIRGYGEVIIDLGTGDGRFVYKNALKCSEVFYIGIDPSDKQLKVSAREVQRKKLDNVLFIIGSAEQLPNLLSGVADEIYVNFPWGTLLETFAKPVEINLLSISGILKSSGTIHVLFGYNEDLEPSETKRLGLSPVDIDYIKGVLIPKYKEIGLNIKEYGRFDTMTQKVETTWQKKLKTGERDWFYIVIAR
jgi:16S rRNA (adenine(1408)-N(1))-methyltransferase